MSYSGSHTLANPGILPVWPVVGTNGEAPLRQANPDSSTARVSKGERAPQTQESARTSMTTKKSTDSSNMDTTSCSADSHVLDFAMLYEKFRQPIHSYIHRLLGSQDDADDVTQEVFIRAYVAWNGLYDRENLSPWLYRIATNLCVDLLRRRQPIA